MKIVICQPVEGPPESAKCCYSVQVMMRQIADVVHVSELVGTLPSNVDVSRARDRLMRAALWNTDATHMLWWDEDVLPDSIQSIRYLRDSGLDCVGIPYRRKKEPEDYPYRIHGPDGATRKLEVVNGCIEVDWLAFGFMMTTRKCLQDMWDAYKDTRWYFDLEKKEGQSTHHLTVGAFDLLYTEEEPGPDGSPWRCKLSEDYSFCKSYRAIGGKVHMYVGEGSPAAHIGSKVYRGTREGLVHGS